MSRDVLSDPSLLITLSESLSQSDHKPAASGKTFESVPRKTGYTGNTSL